MTATTDDERALLRAAGRSPDCDTTRLALADAVDDAGDHDRAEFIRVQVEIERAPSFRAPELDPLRIREHELLSRNPQWRPACPVCNRDGNRRDTGQPCCGGSGRVGTLARGLLESVEVPRLETVLEACPRCVMTHTPGYCPMCRGKKWVATPWAAGLMRDPFTRVVRRVMVGDREPHDFASRGTWGWCRMSNDMPDPGIFPAARIPDPVFLALEGGEEAFPPASAWRTCPAPDAARLALSEAVARALRALVPA